MNSAFVARGFGTSLPQGGIFRSPAIRSVIVNARRNPKTLEEPVEEALTPAADIGPASSKRIPKPRTAEVAEGELSIAPETEISATASRSRRRTAVDEDETTKAVAELAGPPAMDYPCKLRLRQDSKNQDLFFFEHMDTSRAAAAASPDIRGRFFLDPEGRHTNELQDWLCLAEDLHHKGQPILPLFINGLVKSGKSYMLNEVLPAVANTYYCSNGSSRQHVGVVLSEPNFLPVSCVYCDHSRGSGGLLQDFLFRLKRSAAKQQLSAAASTPIPSDCSTGAMLVAIRDFMQRLPRDRLNFLLLDEAERFYPRVQPMPDDCLSRGLTPDVDPVLHIRCILKELLLDSPHWVAWAVTGSSMAMLWANIAATPTNGFPLIMNHHRLNLSPTVSMGVLQVAWEQLKAQEATWDQTLPNDLVWRSLPQIAMLAYLCKQWTYMRKGSTAAEVVNQTMMLELSFQVLSDLLMVLKVLGQPAEQLLRLRELLDPMAGVEPAKLPLAFKVHLASFATKREGRLYLDYPLLALALKNVDPESGEMYSFAHWINKARVPPPAIGGARWA